MELAANILETIMIVSFGISWPINLAKAFRSRSTGGKSVLFDYFILFGYICGVASKIMTHTFNLAFYFYFPNITMVACDILLYYRNRKLEKANALK
ncbi:MAG: hypothetical protein ACI3V3_05465 [Faecousia sp.]